MVYTYILRGVDEWYYCGIAKDVTVRLQQHNNGLSTSTRHHRPLTLQFIHQSNTRAEARSLEVLIKNTGVKRWYRKYVKR
jgi:predicted GIY-YIG superfamily endonuclease